MDHLLKTILHISHIVNNKVVSRWQDFHVTFKLYKDYLWSKIFVLELLNNQSCKNQRCSTVKKDSTRHDPFYYSIWKDPLQQRHPQCFIESHPDEMLMMLLSKLHSSIHIIPEDVTQHIEMGFDRVQTVPEQDHETFAQPSNKNMSQKHY